MSRIGVQPTESLQLPNFGTATGRSRADLRSSTNSFANQMAWDTARSEELETAAIEELSTARFNRVRTQKKREELLVEQQRSLKHFILANFNRKECTLFEAKDGKKCACGEEEGNHEGLQSANAQTKWSEEALKLSTTNAYGRITLKNEGFDNRDPIHFVRLCDTDGMDKILELMKIHWQLADPQKPSLCISVIGGAKNFKLEGRKKDVFHHGLIRAAQTTNAWIITSGLNLGITRVVGNALEEGRASHWEKSSRSSKLRCIGVAPWGYVLNRKDLVNKLDPSTGEVSLNVEYKISNVISKGQPVSLNANHTHYLLVDDGKRNRYGGSKSGVVKAKLQEEINKTEGISVVLLIVEGGLDIFEETLSMINCNIPVVVCDNTGRAADIIAYAFKKVQKAEGKTLQENQQADVRDRMISAFKETLWDPKTDKVLDKKVDDNIFKEIQNNSVEIWKFNMYFLVHEYHTRPVLAVPFVIVEDIFRFIRFLACRLPCCNKTKEDDESRRRRHRAEDAELRGFASHCLSLVQTRQDQETKNRIEFRIQNIYGGLDELYKMCDRIDERFEDDRHQTVDAGGVRESSATSAKPKYPLATAAAASGTSVQSQQLPTGGRKSPTVSVNEDVEPEKPKPSKELGLPPIDPDTRPSAVTPRLQMEPPSPPPAAFPAVASDAEAAAKAERKRQRRAEKEHRREERRQRRRERSRSRRRQSDVDESKLPGAAGGGFAYQTLNDFNDFGAAEAEGGAGPEDERLADVERRLRNMETATTDSLSSIEKLLRQILKDRSGRPDYARLQ